MAKRSFNLLVKPLLQKDFTDKLYDFVTGPLRYIVVLIIFVIVIVFAFRLPSDIRLKDLEKETERLSKNIDIELYPEQIAKYQEISKKENLVSNYENLLITENNANGKVISTSFVLDHINTNINKFNENIKVDNISIERKGTEILVNIRGISSRFQDVSTLQQELKKINNVKDVIVNNISSEEGQTPSFNIIVLFSTI